MTNDIFIEPGISRGNSLYQEQMLLERSSTISRAVRQAKLEQAKAYNAMKENHNNLLKNELEAKVLEEEAAELTGAKKELKLFEAKQKTDSLPIEYGELIRDAIVKYNFYNKFLEQHSEVGFEQFEAEEKMYFECKKILDHAEKLGHELVFNEETLKIPAIHQMANHKLVITEYSNKFSSEIIPSLSGGVDDILKLHDSACEK